MFFSCLYLYGLLFDIFAEFVEAIESAVEYANFIALFEILGRLCKFTGARRLKYDVIVP